MDFTSEHVVLTLSPDRLVEIVLLADGQGVEHMLSIPVTRGPVEGFSIFDNFVETTTDLLNRS